jgi:hypothetical protein
MAARARNSGTAAMPTTVIAPLLRKIRRVMLIALSYR